MPRRSRFIRSRLVALTIVSAAATPAVGPLAVAGAAHAHEPAGSYTVQRGDGFHRIAKRTGVSVDAILAANGLTIDSVIHPGQVLVIPRPGLPKQVVGREQLVPVFEQAASEAGIPADLLMAIAYHESRWQPDAVSSAGALGLCQLMPRTAAWVARDLVGDASLDPRLPADNARIAAHLFAYLLERADGDVVRALAMYAQGEGGVKRNGVIASSVAFAARVAELRRQF